MKIDEIYETESQFLKASNLPAGKEIEVTIDAWDLTELENKKKVCLSFQGREKKLVLNKTNAMTISHVYGGDCSLWLGKPIFLYSTKVDYAGQMVDAIRVRVPLETASQDNMDDDIPF